MMASVEVVWMIGTSLHGVFYPSAGLVWAGSHGHTVPVARNKAHHNKQELSSFHVHYMAVLWGRSKLPACPEYKAEKGRCISKNHEVGGRNN